MSIHLILGGARSGKSAYVEKLAIESALPVTYIATAQIYDDEFKARVQHHKDRRPDNWKLIEEPHFLDAALQANNKVGTVLIIDCLTLWLAQWMCEDCKPPSSSSWQQQRQALLKVLPSMQAEVFLVSNEVGMGIVPLGEINRQFQDEQGRLNQAVAQIADKVSFIAAGLPITLKG
jgi:adenosylcobinamide kinase / adenosylcobinamide-phosphate guanylyltransferase